MKLIKPAANTGFASGGVTCKLGALCFYSSLVLVDSFVLRNPPVRKARKRCGALLVFQTVNLIFHNLKVFHRFVSEWIQGVYVYHRKNRRI